MKQNTNSYMDITKISGYAPSPGVLLCLGVPTNHNFVNCVNYYLLQDAVVEFCGDRIFPIANNCSLVDHFNNDDTILEFMEL